jgi:hypothetical protein
MPRAASHILIWKYVGARAIVYAVLVAAPFFDIPRHIVQAQFIGLFLSYFMGRFVGIAGIPSYLLYLLTASILVMARFFWLFVSLHG